MTDDEPELAIEFTNEAARRCRYRFVKQSDAEGWRRIEEHYRDGEWHLAGGETVANVAIEADQGIAEAVLDGPGCQISTEVPGP